jgi:HK97 family phage major capsid protein/HK97 family phage prohead protease
MMDRIESKAAFSVDEEGRIEGLASVFGTTDRGGDIVHKGAFAGAKFPIPMLAGHNQAETVGVWEEGIETPEGLRVKGRLTLSVQRAREIRDLILAKALQGLSIGYVATRKSARRGGGRDLHAVDLLEISVVAVPMHPGARITSAKEMTMTEKPEDKDEGAIAALEAKMTDLEKKADNTALVTRLDKLEAKMNRPGGETKAEPAEDRKAFGTYLRFGPAAPAEEIKALTVASDPQGGYLAPAEMSAEFIRDLVELSPVRSVASVRTTTAGSVIYPTRTGITNARWRGETQAAEASEPTFGQAEVEVNELATFTDISNTLLADASQAEAEVRLSLTEDFAQKEGLAFVSGSGVGQPEGVMTHAGIAHTVSGHATQVTADALIRLMYAQPATYRNAGVWAMNGATLAALRLLKDGQNNFLWQPSYQAGQPETILGRPVIELPDMDDVAAGTEPIIFGDFSGYRIVDRLALSVLVNPYLRATEGITRIHATRRTGARVIQAAKFRKLRIAAA